MSRHGFIFTRAKCWLDIVPYLLVICDWYSTSVFSKLPGVRKICAHYGNHGHSSLAESFDGSVKSCVSPVSWDEALLPPCHLLLLVGHEKQENSSEPGRFSFQLHLPFFLLRDFFYVASSDAFIVGLALLVVFPLRLADVLFLRPADLLWCIHDFPAGWLLAFCALTECLGCVWLEYPSMMLQHPPLRISSPSMMPRNTLVHKNTRTQVHNTSMMLQHPPLLRISMSRLTEPTSNGKPLAHPIGHKATSTRQKVSLLAFRRLEAITFCQFRANIFKSFFIPLGCSTVRLTRIGDVTL